MKLKVLAYIINTCLILTYFSVMVLAVAYHMSAIKQVLLLYPCFLILETCSGRNVDMFPDWLKEKEEGYKIKPPFDLLYFADNFAKLFVFGLIASHVNDFLVSKNRINYNVILVTIACCLVYSYYKYRKTFYYLKSEI